jgi:hypothetical protein
MEFGVLRFGVLGFLTITETQQVGVTLLQRCLKFKVVLHTTPLQLLLTKDVVKDIPLAMGYPAVSTRCLNQ